jgi:hypothetical protein
MGNIGDLDFNGHFDRKMVIFLSFMVKQTLKWAMQVIFL